ncbi:hypothetical protein N7478_004906 [Penicillium angulare]|uniref:uncharacterized protein n=1 Tax=Penicillium angulare TaxID=116970 RepID=UPI00253F99C6|nr:uncharacterized protein N7478_004906 [Penicillium angulare]KAJ5279534.1 hypothetical protein N7478_004906 [Penicillium angulare]
MDTQDGISVRPMRLKVLYTFDNENKTNCLARWPHVLEIQTAHLDENTAVGVIELKTCIQAIVSASPELVAQLGKDYTVYAYDYSEYETPLVGQGMLSWVLASSSPTPEAPAHQSKTMVTGRVCKNPLGLFSKGAGAQETLEVKLRLVPVPTVMQSQYLDSMQKYRDLSNMIPHDFDAQSWTNFLRQNPALMDAARNQSQDRMNASSPMGGSGIERFHQILSEGATPREFSGYERNEPMRSISPTQSFGAPSRVATPGAHTPMQHPQPHSRQQFNQSSDMIRPSSSASNRDDDFQTQRCHSRRDSIQSGYASGGDDPMDPQPRKRAKVYQASWPGKSDMNIERQPSSLRVAASTAASVRIHRPTPVNPAIAAEQSLEEPVRPPTPIMRPGNGPRRPRLPASLLREFSVTSYTTPYLHSDDIATDQTGQSPEESRYQGLFEPPFTMPSSPPIMDARFAAKSSPVLPPIGLDTDSGFMSGGLEDFLDSEAVTPIEGGQRAESQGITDANRSRPVRSAVQINSPASVAGTVVDKQAASTAPVETPKEQFSRQSLPPQPRPISSAGSRPASRNSVRLAPKPMPTENAPVVSNVPASDPVAPSCPPLQHSQTWPGPMSDVILIDPSSKSSKRRSSAKKRAKIIQDRLEEAIKSGEAPPFCENCGCIETPSWRRAWSLEVEGDEEAAKERMKDSTMLFYLALDRDSEGAMTKFKIYQKSPHKWGDEGWTQVLLCNPCGLWLHKFKVMRPEEMWNKSNQDGTEPRKKRPVRNRRNGGPLSNPSTRTRSQALFSMTTASSPAPTEASSVQPDEGATPQVDNTPGQEVDQEQEQDDEDGEPPSKRRRANSAEPPRSTESAKARWDHDDALEALQRAIQSSPARNMSTSKTPASEEPTMTPKPLRRALFTSSRNDSPLKEMDASKVNSCSPRRSPRFTSRSEKRSLDKENQEPTPRDDLDDLFESPSMDFGMPISPTPRRRQPGRSNAMHERRLSLPCESPSSNRHKDVRGSTPSTRLTAERLQRIQEAQGSPEASPRQQRATHKHDTASAVLSHEEMQSEAFQSLDGMILDIFDDAPGQADFFQFSGSKDEGHNWVDWLPTDYVSPSGSESNGDADEDLINAILSDPTVLKENLHNSAFNPFVFADSQVPDSGFFSSDALQTEPADVPKPQSANDQSVVTKEASPAA